MAILIPNMDVPENCGECPLNHDNDYCVLTRTELWNNAAYFDYHKKRMTDCPLMDATETLRNAKAVESIESIRDDIHYSAKRYDTLFGYVTKSTQKLFLDDDGNPATICNATKVHYDYILFCCFDSETERDKAFDEIRKCNGNKPIYTLKGFGCGWEVSE